MRQKNTTSIATAAQHLLDPAVFQERSLATGFMLSVRLLTPCAFTASLIPSMAAGKVD